MGAEFFLIVSMMGCGGTPMDQQIPITRGRAQYNRQIDTLGVESAVPVHPDSAWSVLEAVYADLGLTMNFREPAGRRLGACYQSVRSRLGKELVSTYIDCGESRGSPNADRFEVAITVLTTIQPSSSRTSAVYTFVLGVGSDPSTSGTNRIWCYSRGALEERIREGIELRARL